MASTPPLTWSRHAFDTVCKFKLLLNNMCESFNHVLKPARGKAILTHIHNKREGVITLVNGLMP